MTTAAAVIGVLLACVALDRALLRAEARGWIYYRRRKASPGTAAGAALAMQALLEPRAVHAIELAATPRLEDEDGERGGPRGVRR